MADVTLTVTGLSSTSSLGDLSYTGVTSGYGRYTWGQANWNDSDLIQQGWGRDFWSEGIFSFRFSKTKEVFSPMSFITMPDTISSSPL